MRELTKALLSQDFGIDLVLPEDRLCPPVPNRLNYILWLEDLIGETTSTGPAAAAAEENDLESVVGIDIGTGASAIYPLLGCSLHPTWTFYGLESDEKSFRLALDNIERNGLGDRITLLKNTDTSPFLLTQHAVLQDSKEPRIATFTMCNPPFYANREEMENSSMLKADGPTGTCTASPSELITPGGEVKFTNMLLAESLILRTKIQWYSTMFGKLESLKLCIASLRHAKIDNYAITELIQGHTKRWAVAWSFDSWRPLMMTSRPSSLALQELLPYKTQCHIPLDAKEGISLLLENFCREFYIDWEWITIKSSMSLFIVQNTWSRQARRRMKAGNLISDTLGKWSTRIRVEYDPQCINLTWQFGSDVDLWKSFCEKLRQYLR